MATTAEWSEEKCLQLIREFRARRVLWDQKDPFYFKKTIKPLAWEEIAEELGVSPDKCKHKMMVLMSSFRREKARIMHSIKDKKDPSQVYKSTWFAFKELAFLLDKENERKRQLTGADLEDLDEDLIQISELTTLKHHLDTSTLQKRRRISLSVRESDQSPTPGTSQPLSEREEEIRSFTSFIGNKMKKYSDGTKNAVQQAICDIIFKADQNYYESNVYEKFTIIDEEPDPLNKALYNSPNGTVIKIQNDSDASD